MFYLDIEAVVNETVVRLQVAVHTVELVDVCHTFGNSNSHCMPLSPRQPTAPSPRFESASGCRVAVLKRMMGKIYPWSKHERYGRNVGQIYPRTYRDDANNVCASIRVPSLLLLRKAHLKIGRTNVQSNIKMLKTT